MDQTALLGGKPPYGWFYVRAMPRGLIGLSSLKCTLGHFDTSAPRGREVRLLKAQERGQRAAKLLWVLAVGDRG